MERLLWGLFSLEGHGDLAGVLRHVVHLALQPGEAWRPARKAAMRMLKAPNMPGLGRTFRGGSA